MSDMTDLILTIAHHLTVFTLVGIFAAEWILLRPGLDNVGLRRLVTIDRAYGAVAGLVVGAGVLRVLFGASGWDYYAGNWMFWLKMGAFALAGLATIPPTISILRWGRALGSDARFVVPEGELSAARRWLTPQLLLLLVIPVLAAAMARGYGV